MNNQKGIGVLGIILAFAGIIVISLGSGVGLRYYQDKILKKPDIQTSINKPTVCTQEAEICPDGSSVGRIGPNCEFAECSSVNMATTTQSLITTSPSQSSSPSLTNGVLDCKDFDCLITAAGKCSLANATIGSSYSLSPFVMGALFKGTTSYEIKGMQNEKCEYTAKVIDNEAVLDMSAFNKDSVLKQIDLLNNMAEAAIKSGGSATIITASDTQKILASIDSGEALAKVKEQLVGMNKTAQEAIGMITNCEIPVGELVKRLTDLKNGAISVVYPDPYCATIPPSQ